jgi:hypothetical protein
MLLVLVFPIAPVFLFLVLLLSLAIPATIAILGIRGFTLASPFVLFLVLLPSFPASSFVFGRVVAAIGVTVRVVLGFLLFLFAILPPCQFIVAFLIQLLSILFHGGILIVRLPQQLVLVGLFVGLPVGPVGVGKAVTNSHARPHGGQGRFDLFCFVRHGGYLVAWLVGNGCYKLQYQESLFL